jgi:hypothetical protein
VGNYDGIILYFFHLLHIGLYIILNLLIFFKAPFFRNTITQPQVLIALLLCIQLIVIISLLFFMIRMIIDGFFKID